MSYSVRVHVGRAGSGKSYTAKRVADRWRSSPVAIWDANHEYAGPTSKDGLTRPCTTVRDFRAFLEQQASSKKRLSKCLVFQVDIAHFDAWCNWVRRTGGMLAVVDEAHLVSRPGSAWRRTGKGAPRPSPFFELITTARHRSLDVLICTQRPACIDRSATAQVTELYAWHTTESRDLAWFAELAGKEWAAGLAKLEKRRFSRWTP